MALQDDIEFAISSRVVPVYVVGRDDQLEVMGEADAAAEVVELLRDRLSDPELVSYLDRRFGYAPHPYRRILNAVLDVVIGDK